MKIGKFFGVPVYLHWTWLLFMALLAWFGGLPLTLLVFFFVVAHEYGHVFSARKFGYPTQNITLYPLGGVALIRMSPLMPARHELHIALAGPAVNLGVFVGTGTALFVFDPYISEELFERFFFPVISINTALFLFNLLPMFPMDGGRVLRSVASMITGNHLGATIFAVRVGQILACILVVVGVVVGHGMLCLIAALTFFISQREIGNARFTVLFSNALAKIATAINRPDLIGGTVDGYIDALTKLDEKVAEESNVGQVLSILREYQAVICCTAEKGGILEQARNTNGGEDK